MAPIYGLIEMPLVTRKKNLLKMGSVSSAWSRRPTVNSEVIVRLAPSLLRAAGAAVIGLKLAIMLGHDPPVGLSALCRGCLGGKCVTLLLRWMVLVEDLHYRLAWLVEHLMGVHIDRERVNMHTS